MQAGHVAAQEGEARAGQPRSGFKIHAEGRGHVRVFARGEIEAARGAPAGNLDIILLARAIGHIVGGQVGDDFQRFFQLRRQFIGANFKRDHFTFQRRNFGLDCLSGVAITFGHGRADQF